jgi:hypothetical protein
MNILEDLEQRARGGIQKGRAAPPPAVVMPSGVAVMAEAAAP